METDPITEADIAAAEKLLAIAYTAQERAQMVGNRSRIFRRIDRGLPYPQ